MLIAYKSIGLQRTCVLFSDRISFENNEKFTETITGRGLRRICRNEYNRSRDYVYTPETITAYRSSYVDGAAKLFLKLKSISDCIFGIEKHVVLIDCVIKYFTAY